MEISDEFKKKQVATLRDELKKEGCWDDTKHDDFTLHRFLNPKSYNTSEAKLAWNQWLLWRKEWGVDTILETDVLDPKQQQRFIEIYPHGLHGTDIEGQPVLIYRLGRTKFSPLLSEFPEVVRQKMHAQLYEFVMRVALPACSLAAGKRIDRVTTIYDLEGITMMSTSSCATVLTSTTKILGLYYPETLAHLLIINAPSMFDSVFYASKGMLSPATQKKIQVFGKATTKAELAKLISPDQLPKFLGGSSGDNLADSFGPWTSFEAAAPANGKAPEAAEAAKKPDAAPAGDADADGVKVTDIAIAVVATKPGPAAKFQRLGSSSREEFIETFHSCIDNNFDFNELGISSAESRFLSHYVSASKRYAAPSFVGYQESEGEEEVCEVEVIPEEEPVMPAAHVPPPPPPPAKPAVVEKPSVTEQASKCCVIM